MTEFYLQAGVTGVVVVLFSYVITNIIKIIAEKKEISQAKIVQMTGLPRLKVFRIIEKMKNKGIIKKENKNKKIRIIKIDPSIGDLF